MGHRQGGVDADAVAHMVDWGATSVGERFHLDTSAQAFWLPLPFLPRSVQHRPATFTFQTEHFRRAARRINEASTMRTCTMHIHPQQILLRCTCLYSDAAA